MRRSIGVVIGEAAIPVGTLHFSAEGNRRSAGFTYSPAWLAESKRFAIDPNLPLVEGPQFHRPGRDAHASAFFGAIADTEPDGWGAQVIRRDFAKRRKEVLDAGGTVEDRQLTELDFLLAVDDVSRIGALRFQDEDGGFLRMSTPGRRATPPLMELGAILAATKAIELHEETAADLAYLRGRGTSLGGMRPKCSVIDDDGALGIAKFPSVRDERSVPKGEVLALRLAAIAGIRAAGARTIYSDGIPVALIRRFDRNAGKRIMYVSARTLLGAKEDEHAYTEVADAIRRHGDQPARDIAELWRRIAFSVLITNIDDHLNNHGFLHVTKDRWALSPAFDINPSPEKSRDLKTWISEDHGPAASIDSLMAVAGYFGLGLPQAREILTQVATAVDQWRTIAMTPDVGMTATEADHFEPAFEHPERRVAAKAVAAASVVPPASLPDPSP